MFKEFKKFIMRGNVIDLAIAVVIGAAFGAIVKSLVDDIIMPIIGFITAGINFSELLIPLGAASIKYGNLIQVIIQFLIIALVVFLVVKLLNRFKKKAEEAPAVKAEQIVLLEEIRDLLKK